jgi:hypothetical protein
MEIAAMASDVFLKIAVTADKALAHRVDHQFIKLGSDFDRIGDAFIDLIADASKLNDLPAHDAFIKHDVHTIGYDFIKLGVDTIKLDDVLHKFDDIVLSFVDQTLKLDTGQLSDDFLKLDTDLLASSTHSIELGDAIKFAKLDLDAESSDQVILKIADGFSDFGGDLHKVGDDFITLGADFIKLADLSDSSTIDSAFIALGGDALKIAGDFQTVSDDLLKIATDFRQSADSELTLKIDEIALKIADDFQSLVSHLKTLDADIQSLGGDYLKLGLALPDHEPPRSPESGVGDSLHQILQLVHDFSLL